MNLWKLGETYICLTAGVPVKSKNLCEGCCFLANGKCSVDRYSELTVNECIRTFLVDGVRRSAIFKVVTIDECLELLNANKIAIKVPELVEPFSLSDSDDASDESEVTEQATEQFTDDNNEGSYND